MTSAPQAAGGAVLALDPGTVRVGIAASDPTATIATPLEPAPRSAVLLWPRLLSEVRTRDVRLIVVGLPRRLDGSEGEAAAAAREFAAEVARRTGVEVSVWDERFTTVQAERELIAAGVRRRRRRETRDGAAAALLLQSWLESPAGRERRAAG